MIFTSTIPANVRAPVNIVEYLARRFTYHSADEWISLVNDGRVSVNNNRATIDTMIIANDTLAYEPYDFEEPDADLSYTIIYEDDRVIAVNKPANLLVHRAGKSFRNNLTYHLRNINDPPYPDCQPVHRLDRNTSGVVLVAKDQEQAAIFGKLFTDGNVTKRYKAVVHGCPDLKTPYTIDAPIAKDKGHDDIRSKFKVDIEGKPAVTIIESIERMDDSYSLLSIKPITGRTHQIRVHLSHIDHPIAGDTLYGSTSEHYKRQALHCESLRFIHPHTSNLCIITAPLPDYLTNNPRYQLNKGSPANTATAVPTAR